jgi:alkylhydroperoxidase family enzyme
MMAARVSPLPLEQWPTGLLEEAHKLTNGGINAENHVYCTLANYPSLLLAWLRLGAHLYRRSTLPPRQRELVILRAAARSAGRYPLAQHIVVARQCGIDEEEIAAVVSGSAITAGEDLDKGLLLAVDELLASGALGETTWDALRSCLTVPQCLDLTATTAFYRLASWFLNCCRTPLERDQSPASIDAGEAQAQLAGDAYNGVPRIAQLAVADWPQELLAETAQWPRFKDRPELRKAGVYQTFANHPALLDGIGGLMAHILSENSLSDCMREIVIIRSCARACGAYPYRQHVRIGREVGLSEYDLTALAQLQPRGMSKPAGLLASMVDALYRDNDIDDRLWPQVTEKLTDEQFMDVIVVSGFYSLVSSVLNVARTTLEPGDADLPAHFYRRSAE